MANSNGLLRGLVLVAFGAAVGGAAGWFASELNRDAAGPAEVSALVARVTEIERRVPADAPRAARGRTRVAPDAASASEGDRASGDFDHEAAFEWAVRSDRLDPEVRVPEGGGDGVVPRAPPPEFVDLVRSAIDEIKRQDAEGSVEQRVADQRKKYLYEVDKKLTNYRDKLGLTDEQVTAFRAAAEAGYDERLQAQLDGKPQNELQALDRKRHREFRDIIGGAAYRDFRKLELDAVARPTIVSIAGQAGVDREQRDRIERLLDEHIEGIVDLEVRVRTEELDPEERRAIQEEMQDASRSAWDRLRGNILDAEQRERVPKRLR